MDIRALEQLLVDRLTEELTDLDVILFPDTQSFEMTNADATVLVRYAQGRFSTPSSSERHQNVVTAFEVLVYSRSLRLHQGAMDTMARVRKVLTGFIPPMCSHEPYQVDERFLEFIEDDGVWIYAMTFEIPTVYMYGY